MKALLSSELLQEALPDSWHTAALASSSARPSLLFNSHHVKRWWREM